MEGTQKTLQEILEMVIFIKDNAVMKADFEERMNSVDNHFYQVNDRFDQVESRLEGVESQVVSLEVDMRLVREDIKYIREDYQKVQRQTLEDTTANAKDVLNLQKRVTALEGVH